VKVGQQVLAVSDPGYQSQMLSLKTKPSKMALTRAVSHENVCHTPLISLISWFLTCMSPLAPTLHLVQWTGMPTFSVLSK